jgi:hypothetical protein
LVPLVLHGDMARLSVHPVFVCVLSGFPMLFTLDSSLADLQVSQTHTRGLGFGILLLLHCILLVFPMLILWVVGLTKRALLVLVIFLDLLSFAGLLENNLQLPNRPQRLSM